jgi:(1->4)-alpha-D-glucan 1-alpha-D-glucosylmutase
MIATATHDTKRGEDARARLLALSEMPDEWARALDLWRETISPHLPDGAGAPDANDGAILLQSLLGAWPLELLEEAGRKPLAAFRERMEAYLTKALREAKRHTTWIDPNEAYEGAALDLLRAVLRPGGPFMEGFAPLARRLSFLGMLNGLSRTVLKLTLPGVPDIYQGTEFWDFSLVDPDNRRPVDYAARIKALGKNAPLETLMENWPDGRIKQRILSTLLHDRAAAPELYGEGDYEPLPVRGGQASCLLAFARRHGSDTLAVVVPRLWSRVAEKNRLPLDRAAWGDAAIALPAGCWRNVLTGADATIQGGGALAGDLLTPLPFAVLRRSDPMD